jgi:hypothetical protein
MKKDIERKNFGQKNISPIKPQNNSQSHKELAYARSFFVYNLVADKIADGDTFPLLIVNILQLKNFRVRSAVELEGLKAFIPIIEQFCSDDKTDDEVQDGSNGASNAQKFCKVRRLPWRSTDVQQALLILDAHQEKKLRGAVLARKGNPP